jgi:F-type H+-transporting ATPase subunit b
VLDFIINLAHAGETHAAEAATVAAPGATTHAETAVAATETAHHATEAAGGIAALGLDWKAFLFQLITFVIVLVILRKFVFGKLVATLSARQQAVEDSLKHAAEIEDKLKNAEKTVTGMLSDARKEADDVLSASHKEAAQMVEAAEAKAAKRAEHIVAEAKSQMDVEVGKAREALKKETALLVAAATEHVIGEKLDAVKDAKLIDAALKKAIQERA